MKNKDPYKILGIERTADAIKIKEAYRALASANHPDSGGSHDRMVDINWAYKLLINPKSRAHYDAYGAEDNRTKASAEEECITLFERVIDTLGMQTRADYFDHMRQRIASKKAEMVAIIDGTEPGVAKIRAVLVRIKGSGTVFHSHLESKIKMLLSQKDAAQERIETLDAMVVYLESMEFEVEQPEPLPDVWGISGLRSYQKTAFANHLIAVEEALNRQRAKRTDDLKKAGSGL